MRSVHVFFAAVAAAGMMFGASAGDAVPRDMKLFLCAGQSNMAGRGDLKDVSPIEDQRVGVFRMGVAGAAAATVVGVMRFLGFLCIAAYGVVRYML